MKPRTRLIQKPIHRPGDAVRWKLTEVTEVDPMLLALARLSQTRRRFVQLLDQRITRLEARQRERRP